MVPLPKGEVPRALKRLPTFIVPPLGPLNVSEYRRTPDNTIQGRSPVLIAGLLHKCRAHGCSRTESDLPPVSQIELVYFVSSAVLCSGCATQTNRRLHFFGIFYKKSRKFLAKNKKAGECSAKRRCAGTCFSLFGNLSSKFLEKGSRFIWDKFSVDIFEVTKKLCRLLGVEI